MKHPIYLAIPAMGLAVLLTQGRGSDAAFERKVFSLGGIYYSETRVGRGMGVAPEELMTERRIPDDLPQAQKKHPDQYEADLNPDHLGGQNIGVSASDIGEGTLAAHDAKDATRILADFNMDELRQIPLLTAGTRLKQGAAYGDICDPNRRPFVVEGAQIAEVDQMLVPKAETPYELWNRLIGKVH